MRFRQRIRNRGGSSTAGKNIFRNRLRRFKMSTTLTESWF
ncbi:hypothetical protein QE450_002969 [Paenibacillus sp. SORGH_AS306]|nr:hypothetical protein [Paenibacillus sp. SORGH_AS_0306]MDR6112520.1 hypothetical protein [Paenibacillus sp. SORGH_AS_0338]